MKTQEDIRKAFWSQHPQFKREGKGSQNSYCCDIRTAFCDFVDSLARSGEIEEALAARVTLGANGE